MEFRHSSIQTILCNRLAYICTIRDLWNENDIRPCLEGLVEIKDRGVWVDILRILNLRPRLFSLDTALILFPILIELLFEMYEE